MLLTSLGRVLVASGLFAVTSFMASTAAFAETKAAGITITGTVGSDLAISANPNPSSFVILTGQTGTDVKLGADLKFGSNDYAGLTLTVSPPILKLSKTGGIAADDIAFFVGLNPDPSASNPSVLVNNTFNTNTLVSGGNAATSPTKPYGLYIRYSTPDTQASGVYTSTFTLTATDN